MSVRTHDHRASGDFDVLDARRAALVEPSGR